MFRFYIVSTMDGNVLGTNDESLAKELAACEDYFVIEPGINTWLLSDGTTRSIYERNP